MDIRDILKSFDQLTEGDSTVHKAGPGGYGNRHGTDDVTDQYGKPMMHLLLSVAKVVPQRTQILRVKLNHMTVQH
jgi:hypothetical protein